MIDETTTINGEGSAGLSIKGHYPEKVWRPFVSAYEGDDYSGRREC